MARNRDLASLIDEAVTPFTGHMTLQYFYLETGGRKMTCSGRCAVRSSVSFAPAASPPKQWNRWQRKSWTWPR